MDIAVLAIMAYCIWAYARKGLIKSIIGFGSNIFSLILSKALYPSISKMVLDTPIYDNTKLAVIEKLNIGGIVSSQTQKFEADMINSLGIPQFLKTGLLENNNDVVYNFLNVSSIEDYIGGYIAMMLINIIVVVAVYLIIGIIFKFVFKSLNIFSRLPVIRTFNKAGGAVLGFFWGVILIWILTAIITLFLTQPQFSFLSEGLATSAIAIKFYETNIILQMINKIIL